MYWPKYKGISSPDQKGAKKKENLTKQTSKLCFLDPLSWGIMRNFSSKKVFIWASVFAI
jgi:hypothetical protein